MCRTAEKFKIVSLNLKLSGILLLLGLYQGAFSQRYNFRNFDESYGLAQNYVYTIFQDHRGYLWVGTGNGLTGYNGISFENYTVEDSLADNFITCGICDGQAFWLGHMNGGITYFDGRHFSISNRPAEDASPVTCMAKSPDGRFWGISGLGVMTRLGAEEGQTQSYTLSEQQESVVSFAFIDNENLLVGTGMGLLYCRIREAGVIEVIRKIAKIPESKIVRLTKARNGEDFYVATENDGIFRIRSSGDTMEVAPLLQENEYSFSGIQYLYEDSKSAIWLGSFGGGLIRVDNPEPGKEAGISVYNTANGFTSDNVKFIFEDQSGGIWVGNYGEGLTQVTNKVYSVHSYDKVKYGKAVYSVFSNRQYRWIGTEKGLLVVSQETGDIAGFYGRGMPVDMVTAIYSADGRDIWIGTNGNGIYRIDNERGIIKRHAVGSGSLENSITCITGQHNQIWIGTKKGLCNMNTLTNSVKWYSISQGGLPHNFIQGLYADRSGRLWISSHCNKLAYIMNEKVVVVPVNSRSSTLTFGPITEDADSAIWVGSNGNGVYRIKGDSVIILSTKGGLLSDYCYTLIHDNAGHIWVGHKNGLSIIGVSDLFVKPVHQFEFANAEFRFNSNAAFRDVTGKICFGTEEGLVVYDPAMENTVVRPPVPYIKSITINNEVHDFSTRIVLHPGKYKVRFDFMAINLSDPSLVNYRYKLDGYDTEFESTKSTSATYSNLTEGKYTFILNALNGEGALSDLPLEVIVIIKKPVWKQLWFFPSQALLLLGMLFLYIKRREHRYKEEKRILEEKVQERTFEIQSQKDEIEKSRELIRAKNAEITSSIRYASHIQHAVLPSSEMLEALFPESFVLMLPKDIVSGDFFWFSEKNDKIVFTVADCTGHGVPGAFMSVMSITLLNEIVNVKGITDSAEIVNRLNNKVNHSLRKSKMDGLDMALCVLDRHKGQIQFTGAMNHLVHIHNGELHRIMGDCYSVNTLHDDFTQFTQKMVEVSKGDMIYLTSDGFVDQFGGEKDRKFSVRRFHAALLEIHTMPLANQKKILKKKHLEWKGDSEQTDDILVLGIRF